MREQEVVLYKILNNILNNVKFLQPYLIYNILQPYLIYILYKMIKKYWNLHCNSQKNWHMHALYT